MTQKYLYVRRDLYEQAPVKKLNSKRSFTDMARIFKWRLWFLLAFVMVCLIWLSILLFKNPSSPIILIPMFMSTIVAIITELLREKHLYHEPARKKELEQVEENYQQYIVAVQEIIKKQGINSPEKALKLKQECEAALSAHTDRFDRVGNKTYDLLIGVPLGALIASTIYADKEIALVAMVVVVFIGIAIVGFIRLTQLISFYTDGYFKDKYLLDALNELDYSEKICTQGQVTKVKANYVYDKQKNEKRRN